MTQVSTQAELQAALAAQEQDIQVTADFFINAPQEIIYDVTISSTSGDRWTLVKEDGFDNYICPKTHSVCCSGPDRKMIQS